MTIEVLDPTYGDGAADFAEAARPADLSGMTVGIVSNGKQGTRQLFDAIEAELLQRHGVGDVVRLTKRNYSAPAEAEVMDRAKKWHALIAGVGD